MSKKKMEWMAAHLLSLALGDELSVYCSEWMVAGSIRREEQQVSDIEIVCIPNLINQQPGLFEDSNANMVWPGRQRIAEIADKDNGAPAITKDGSRYIQFTYQGVQVDLFLATPRNFGLILAIRTGPANFSRRLVTKQGYGGYCPSGHKVAEGTVWRQHPITGDFSPIDTPTELELFSLFGMEWMEPEDRR